MGASSEAACEEIPTVTLVWNGPYADTATLPCTSGLYAVTGRVYGGLHVQLLYIGLAKNLQERWRNAKHLAWLGSSIPAFGGGLYFAQADGDVIDKVESVLIYVHQPNQNSAKLTNRPDVSRFLIHNVKDVPAGMLPVVDSGYPWFRYSSDTPLPDPAPPSSLPVG